MLLQYRYRIGGFGTRPGDVDELNGLSRFEICVERIRMVKPELSDLQPVVRGTSTQKSTHR